MTAVANRVASAASVSVLIVDPDSLLQEMIVAGFELYDERFRIARTSSPAEALARIKETDFDAIVTEVAFPGSPIRGVEFLLDLEDLCPQTPVVVLTDKPIAELQGLVRAVAFIMKPPDMDYLFRKVDQIIHQAQESVLRGISLETFLQVLQVEQKTCTLTVQAAGRSGLLYIHRGELIHARTEKLTSKDAVFSMLGWGDYSIKVTETCDAEQTITDRLNAILMEYCVQKDHGLLDDDAG